MLLRCEECFLNFTDQVFKYVFFIWIGLQIFFGIGVTHFVFVPIYLIDRGIMCNKVGFKVRFE